MKYLSPFHILPEGFIFDSLSDKKSLKQARKLVLAEFELQGKTTIIINNQALDKDAVLKYFETLEADENLSFHAEIYDNKPLLYFLEAGSIQNYEAVIRVIEKKEAEGSKKDFLIFIAPYFTYHFNDLLFKAVKENDEISLDILLGAAFPLPETYEADAYQVTYRWYHRRLKNVGLIKERLLRKEFVSSDEIYDLIDLGFIETFNRLPTYFYNIRDGYAFELYEIIVILNNELKRVSLARAVIDAGLLIKAEHSTKEYYEEANEIIDVEDKQKSRFSWIWLYLILQTILIFFHISTCDNKSSVRDSYKLEYRLPQDFQDSLFYKKNMEDLQNELIENRKRMDSIFRSLDSISFE